MIISGAAAIRGAARLKGQVGPMFSDLRYPQMAPDVSGASNLTRALTINGTTVQATCVYDGRNLAGAAGSLSWPERYGVAGGTLSEAGGGALTRGSAGPFTDGTTGAKGDGTGYLALAGTALGNAATDDLVIELLFTYSGALGFIFTKVDGTLGFTIFDNATGLVARIGDAGGYTDVAGAALTAGMLYHAAIFMDRSGSGQLYINAAASGGPIDISSRGGSIDTTTALAVFGSSFPYTQKLYYVAMWHGAAWLDTPLQAAVAAERCARAFGLYAPKATGDAYPAITRASTRYFFVGERFHPIGAGGHAVEADESGSYLSVYGAATSKLGYSSPDGNWAPTNVTDALSALDSPISGIKWTDVTETADNDKHLYATTATWYFVSQNYYCSVEWIVKAGARGLLEFLVADANLGYKGNIIRIDTATWTVLQYGIVGAGADAWWEYVHHAVSPLGNGAYSVRIVGKCIMVGGTGPVPVILGAVTDDAYSAPETYAGNAGAVAYSVVGGSVVLAAAPYYGPPIITAGADATKAAESINSHAGNIPTAGGTIAVEFRADGATPIAALPLFQISDGTANHSVKAYIHTDGTVKCETAESGGDAGSVTLAGAYADRQWHRLVVAWRAGQLFARVDNVSGLDTSATLPTGLNALYRGRDVAGNYFGGDLRNFQVLNVYDEAA